VLPPPTRLAFPRAAPLEHTRTTKTIYSVRLLEPLVFGGPRPPSPDGIRQTPDRSIGIADCDDGTTERTVPGGRK
jgi:hypothetical protein